MTQRITTHHDTARLKADYKHDTYDTPYHHHIMTPQTRQRVIGHSTADMTLIHGDQSQRSTVSLMDTYGVKLNNNGPSVDFWTFSLHVSIVLQFFPQNVSSN